MQNSWRQRIFWLLLNTQRMWELPRGHCSSIKAKTKTKAAWAEDARPLRMFSIPIDLKSLPAHRGSVLYHDTEGSQDQPEAHCSLPPQWLLWTPQLLPHPPPQEWGFLALPFSERQSDSKTDKLKRETAYWPLPIVLARSVGRSPALWVDTTSAVTITALSGDWPTGTTLRDISADWGDGD